MSRYNSKFFETVVTPSHSELYRALGKRVFDLAMTLLTLPFVLPLIGILALLIALDGGNPFYSQDRVGKNGRIYRMWKLRSMVKDADAGLQHDRSHEWGSGQNFGDDPRLTRLGQFLRRSYIDELPQVFNVLIGDMSVVGSRPMTVSQKALYPGEAYCDLRPGITGLWQTSGRHHMTLAECAVYDSHYNRTLSLTSDLAILAAAVKAVLRST